MLLLEHGNNRDNCCEDISHWQPTGKQISYRPYKRTASFNGYFLRFFLIGYIIERIYLTMKIFVMREKLDLLCVNLVSMPYVGRNEYNLIESNKVKTKFDHGQG